MFNGLFIYDYNADATDDQKRGCFDFDFFRRLDDRFNDEMRYKIAKFSQIFKLTGGTSTIPNWRLKQLLLTCGFGAFAPYTDGKLYFVTGGLGGERDHNYIPKEFIFANPHMPDGRTWSANLRIGEECVLAKNDIMCFGIVPALTKHTNTQTQIDLSMYLATISSRMLNVGVSGRDSEAIALDHVFEDLEHGNIKTVVDKNYLQQLKTLPYGGNANILKDYIEFLQYDKASEANELGLSANWNAKRESLSNAETLLNDDATHPYVDGMFECWQEWIDEVNTKYGALLDNGAYKLDWASSWEVAAKETEHSVEVLDDPQTDENGDNDGKGGTDNGQAD